MSYFLKKYLAVAILLGFGGMIFWFFFQNKLIFFVYPKYVPLVVSSGVLVLLLGIYLLFQSSQQFAKNILADHFRPTISILILIPIFLGFLISPRPLSSQTAEQRGINSDFALVTTAKTQNSFSINPENRDFQGWVAALSLDPEPAHHLGNKAHVFGFVSWDPNLSENSFYITRFQISCCAADARPVGIPVVFDPKKFPGVEFARDSWLDIHGILQEGLVGEGRKPVIGLESFTKMATPQDPYIY